MADYYVTTTAGGSGVGTSGDPFTLAQATAQAGTGNNFYVKAGTYGVEDPGSGAVMDVDVAGTQAAKNRWIGYTTTIADFDLGEAPPVVIDATVNTLANCINVATVPTMHVYFRGFQFTGATAAAVNGSNSDQLYFEGCRFNANGTTSGYAIPVDNNLTMVACEIDNNSNGGVNIDNDGTFINCSFHDNAAALQLLAETNLIVIGCLFYAGQNGVQINASSIKAFIGNTLDGDNGASSVALDIKDAAATGVALFNNIFFDFNIAIDESAGNTGFWCRGYNLFFSNNTDYSVNSLHSSDIAGASDPFTDSTSNPPDYSLKTSSEAENAGIDGSIIDER